MDIPVREMLGNGWSVEKFLADSWSEKFLLAFELAELAESLTPIKWFSRVDVSQNADSRPFVIHQSQFKYDFISLICI